MKRKLKLQVQISIDGFIAGANGEMDWVERNWDDKLINYIQGITDPVDCIVLGRKLAEGFIPYWADVAGDTSNPENEAGKKFTDTPKIVFSRTLGQSTWENTVLATKPLAEEITGLKAEPGGDIIAYGGASFVRSLIKENLIDEYHLLVNPTAVGMGMPIFSEIANPLSLQMETATAFDCGIVLLRYVRKG